MHSLPSAGTGIVLKTFSGHLSGFFELSHRLNDTKLNFLHVAHSDRAGEFHLLFDHHSYPVKIPRWRVQDIDTEDDWKRAELLYKHIKENYYG